MNRLHAVIAVWLNASQRSLVGVGMNRSGRRRSVKCFERSNGLDTSLYKVISFTVFVPEMPSLMKPLSGCTTFMYARSRSVESSRLALDDSKHRTTVAITVEDRTGTRHINPSMHHRVAKRSRIVPVRRSIPVNLIAVGKTV